MPFDAKIIADSISPTGKRITTMELFYWRAIHSEFMTHRVFARSASSSRAIPISQVINQVLTNPAMPVHWGKNQSGMQAREELHGAGRIIAEETWLKARDAAVEYASKLAQAGAAKQLVNRILEPFSHIRVVVTATEWANFYTLRRHEDAQPEIKHLADLMWAAHQASLPRVLLPGQWHLPYITDEDYETVGTTPFATLLTDHDALSTLLKVSTARCARVSYRLHDGSSSTLERDLDLYQRLVGAQPMHASPAEHQATPDLGVPFGAGMIWTQAHLHGPFQGWVQHRKLLAGENVTKYQGFH